MQGSGATNPFAISLVLHAIILSVFALVKVSSKPVPAEAMARPTAKIQAISRLIEKPQALPKPKIISSGSESTALFNQSAAANKIPPFSLNQNSRPVFPATAKAEAIQSLTSKNLPVCNMPAEVNSNFFGNLISDKRVCFVVDSSGSMQGIFGKVKQELKDSIGSLEPDRYFQIIFFGDNQLYNFSKNGLVRASGPVKQKAIEFIDSINPKGRTNALDAITNAMQNTGTSTNSPDIIYLLTDGFNLAEKKQDNLLMNILVMRSSHCEKTRFNTIAYWPKSQDEIILKQLAEMTGGTFTKMEN